MKLLRFSRLSQFFGLALGLAALLWAALPGQPALTEEAADSESTASVETPPGEIRFMGKNKVAKANSVFHQWKVTRVEIDPADLSQGVVELEIDIASVDTGIGKRDEHLRTADFFDVEQYPTATVRLYEATLLADQPEGETWYSAKMDLEIKGIKKTQDIKFRLVDAASFEVQGEFTILRTDFGVGEPYTRLNPLSIEDEIELSFEATLLGDS